MTHKHTFFFFPFFLFSPFSFSPSRYSLFYACTTFYRIHFLPSSLSRASFPQRVLAPFAFPASVSFSVRRVLSTDGTLDTFQWHDRRFNPFRRQLSLIIGGRYRALRASERRIGAPAAMQITPSGQFAVDFATARVARDT